MISTAIDYREALVLTESEWVDFLSNKHVDRELTAPVPAFPDVKVQESFVGSSGDAAIQEAGVFYSKVMSVLDAAGVARANVGRVLDFGCGWGRISRFFLRHCAPGDLLGADIDESCVRFCADAMQSAKFMRSSPNPPLAVPERSFDLVVAYS